MTKLTAAQRDLLAEAAKADKPLDAASVQQATAASLIRRGLLISISKGKGPSRLTVTDAGRAALGAPDPARATQPVEAPAAPKGKIGAIVALLRRPEGASVEAMMAATGWQAHSVRGAISGAIKKARGLTVASEKTEHGRTYRIEEGAGA
jgi:hypothetical protein